MKKILTYKKTWIAIGSIIVALLLFDYFGTGMIIDIRGGLFTMLQSNSTKKPILPSKYKLNYQKIFIETKDNLKLCGYVIRTNPEKQKGTMIFVHGIRSSKECNLPRCKMLADSGYNSVIIDLRGHGESDGEYCTYGYYEKDDLSILIDSISCIPDLSKNIGIWGASLGGAVAMQTMAIDKRIKYGIIESTFSDLNTIIHDYTRLCFGFDIPFLTNYLLWRAECIADFKAEDVVPSQSARQITQPVLFAHGAKDDRINIEYGLKTLQILSARTKNSSNARRLITRILGLSAQKSIMKLFSNS